MGTNEMPVSCTKNGLKEVNGFTCNEDTYLFNQNLLDDLDFSQCRAKYNPPVSITSPGPGLKVRPLCLDDFDKEYLKLLQELTIVGHFNRELFSKTFTQMKNCPHTYYVIVVEDLNKEKVVGTVTLLVEQKFIHTAATRGRIEDVVVSEQYRGRQLGKLLVDVAYLLAEKLQIYKLSLDCKEPLVSFYKSFGFYSENVNILMKRFKD